LPNKFLNNLFKLKFTLLFGYMCAKDYQASLQQGFCHFS
jgi:hypothetical protein